MMGTVLYQIAARLGTIVLRKSPFGQHALDSLRRSKQLLRPAAIDCAECSARANIRVHGSMAGLESRGSGSISSASRAGVLASTPGTPGSASFPGCGVVCDRRRASAALMAA